MARIVLAGMLVAIAACGRFDFDSLPASSDGGGGSDGAVATVLLPCAAPTRFQNTASNVTAVVATPTLDGFALFAADANHDLGGSTYTFQNGTLAPATLGVAIDSASNGALGAVSSGHAVLLSSGTAAMTGTNLYPLSDALVAAGPTLMRNGLFAAHDPLAASGGDGSFAFGTVDTTTGEVDARKLDLVGDDASTASVLVPSTSNARDVSLESAAAGYVVAFDVNATAPHAVKLLALDTNLAATAGPVGVDASQSDQFQPVVAASAGTIAVAWRVKTASDELWLQVFDTTLHSIAAAARVSSSASGPVIAADPTGFQLAWRDVPTSTLAGAHVGLDGTLAPRTIANSGGTPSAWAIARRAAQPVLVWVEANGTGPALYFDPMCGP